MTDGEGRFSCNVHVYLFYEPRKKTAIRMLLQSSARLSCGKDQPMCLTWLDGSRAWVLRKSLFYEFTTSACNSPLLKPFYGGLQGRFPCFAPISSHSPQKSSNIRAIYQNERKTYRFTREVGTEMLLCDHEQSYSKNMASV